MLTRNEIDKIISEIQTEIATDGAAARSPTEAKQAGLMIGGLALLGNLLGDISDIAAKARES